MWFARSSERAQGERFLETLAGPTALLILGQAGIGKTTLWQALADSARARGIRALACRGVETEAQLSLAALANAVAAQRPAASDRSTATDGAR